VTPPPDRIARFSHGSRVPGWDDPVDLELDPATRQVTRSGTTVKLSPKGFSLLELFMRRPGEVLSRAMLLEHAWDFAYEGDSNVVDVYIRYLRDKIDRPFGRDSIQTVWGVGYRLNP